MKVRERIFASRRLEQVYRQLVNEEDARVCRDIDDAACRVVPGNFFLQVITQFFTKLGDAVANPKTTLAWLLTSLGAPGAFTAFLVPIRESGSLIPQLFIAGLVRRRAVRKWVYVIGCLLQALAVAAMALIAGTLDGAAAGSCLLASLVMFSLARGLCSVASKDVLGKTVPKTRRGRVNGWSASLAGAVTIGVGALLLLGMAGADSATGYALLLLGAAGLWLLAAGSYALIREFPGATGGGGNAITEAFSRLVILRDDPDFRGFVVARALLLCSALSAPFIVMLAHQRTDGAVALLGLFVIADGIASLLSAPVWGYFSDISSRRVMALAGTLAAGTGLVLVVLVTLVPPAGGLGWLYAVLFFVLAISHAGVRLGRKTYVVDLAGGNRRTDYVAVSNTVIGLILLATGTVGALTTVLPVTGIILILALMGLAGSWMSLRLPEVT